MIKFLKIHSSTLPWNISLLASFYQWSIVQPRNPQLQSCTQNCSRAPFGAGGDLLYLTTIVEEKFIIIIGPPRHPSVWWWTWWELLLVSYNLPSWWRLRTTQMWWSTTWSRFTSLNSSQQLPFSSSLFSTKKDHPHHRHRCNNLWKQIFLSLKVWNVWGRTNTSSSSHSRTPSTLHCL